MSVRPAEASAAAGPEVRRAPLGARRAWHSRDTWWLLALPAILLVAAFFVLPFLLNIRFAFTNWNSYNDNIAWNGFENFQVLIDQRILFESVRNTLIYAVVAMLLQNAVSLTMALALQDTNPLNSLFRSLFFLPVLISAVAGGYIWFAMLAPNGPFNQAVALLMPGFAHAWFGEVSTALVTVAFVDAWKWSGIATLVYIAGLNAIPQEVVEAATIDGATAFQRFWRVRFPLLAPAFTFTVVTTLLGAISAYDVPAATTRGGPGTATMVLNLAMAQQWSSGFYGTGSALSLTLTVIVVVIAIPLVAFLRRREVSA